MFEGSDTGSIQCFGDVDGVGTYARYNGITGIALLMLPSTGPDAALYISDGSNNKIRMLELTSGLFKSVTFDSNVDPSATPQLASLTVYSYNLYACIKGAIVKYSINQATLLSATSKTLFSGSYSGQFIQSGNYAKH